MGTWKHWTLLPFRRRETHKQNPKPPPTTTTTTADRHIMGTLFHSPRLETTAEIRPRRLDSSGIEPPRNSLDADFSSSRLDLDVPFAIQIVPERRSTSAAEASTRRKSNVVARLMGLDLPPPPPSRRVFQRLASAPQVSASPVDHRPSPRLSLTNKENLAPSTLLDIKSKSKYKRSKPTSPPPRPSPPRRSRQFEMEVLNVSKTKAKAKPKRDAGKVNASSTGAAMVARRGEKKRYSVPRGQLKWEEFKLGEVVAEVERKVWESLVEELVVWWIQR